MHRRSLERVVDPCNQFVAHLHRGRWDTQRCPLLDGIAQGLFDFQAFAPFDILQGGDFIVGHQRCPAVSDVPQLGDRVVHGQLTEGLGREECHICQGNTPSGGDLCYFVQQRCHDGRDRRVLEEL